MVGARFVSLLNVKRSHRNKKRNISKLGSVTVDPHQHKYSDVQVSALIRWSDTDKRVDYVTDHMQWLTTHEVLRIQYFNGSCSSNIFSFITDISLSLRRYFYNTLAKRDFIKPLQSKLFFMSERRLSIVFRLQFNLMSLLCTRKEFAEIQIWKLILFGRQNNCVGNR